MERHGEQHGHGSDGYVLPPVADHGVVGQGAGPGGAPPAEEHKSRGILHRSSSSSSSSSSSEDDGMGGRRKKQGMKEKIKKKLPGGHKDNLNQQATAGGAGPYGQQQGHATTAGTGVDAAHGEKKGLMDKIKDKLPGHH